MIQDCVAIWSPIWIHIQSNTFEEIMITPFLQLYIILSQPWETHTIIWVCESRTVFNLINYLKVFLAFISINFNYNPVNMRVSLLLPATLLITQSAISTPVFVATGLTFEVFATAFAVANLASKFVITHRSVVSGLRYFIFMKSISIFFENDK